MVQIYSALDSLRSRAERQAVLASDWISERRDLKFFFWLHLIDPHFRYNPPEPYDRSYDPDFQGTFRLYDQLARKEITQGQAHFKNDLTQAEVRHAIALYDGEIRYADDVLKAFLARVKAMGLYENALIVFASDHGESLGEHGFFFEHGEYLYDATLRIPLIVKFPRSRDRGRRISGKVMIMDIMPTVLSAAGVVDLPPLHGHDLSLYLDNKREPHPVCFAETGLSYFPESPRRYVSGLAGRWVSIRDGDFKLIKIPRPTGQTTNSTTSLPILGKPRISIDPKMTWRKTSQNDWRSGCRALRSVLIRRKVQSSTRKPNACCGPSVT